MTSTEYRELKVKRNTEYNELMAKGYTLAPNPTYTESTHHYNGLNYVKTSNDQDNRTLYTCNGCAVVITKAEIEAIIDEMMLYP